MFAKLINAVFKDREGYVGRKLVAAWSLTLLASFFLILPFPFILFGYELNPLLTSESFATVISIVWTTYFSSNSIGKWTHRPSKDNSQEPEEYS